nr:MAG TPA: hypothetical protein [Caudoviricetes sp.]DAY25108.1 MAG TPA: hypothetical protein [Caudoviricetes sp.]
MYFSNCQNKLTREFLMSCTRKIGWLGGSSWHTT